MSDEAYVYVEDKRCPLGEALAIMTDDWIDAGEYCDQTVFDLRDAIISQQAEIERLWGDLAECRRLLREAVARRLADMTIEWWDRASKEAEKAGGGGCTNA